MIVTIKNLQQQTFTLDFDAEKTVLELKEAIFKERGGEYNVEKQKLIYAGVILEDERSLTSYNVDEKKFVVVMLKRAAAEKPTQAAGTQAENTSASSTSTKPPTPTSEESKPTPTKTSENPPSEGSVASPTVQAQAASNLLMGEEYNKSVESMIEMGYSREMVERAMAASFNNPERAVEYLISGIPESVDLGFEAGPHNRSGDVQEGTAGRRSTEAASPSNDPFEFLRDQPQFLQMRSLVNQNPDLLHAVLQQIGQTNPALLQLISENQDAFLNMLNQPVEGQDTNSSSQQISSSERRAQLSAAALASVAGITEAVRDQPVGERITATEQSQGVTSETRATNQPGTVGSRPEGEGPAIIRLTLAEQDAIERLKAMGFPESLVVEAYIACDKDEQLAANFLISSAFDD